MFTLVNFTFYTFVTQYKTSIISRAPFNTIDSRISGRYITLDHILPILNSYKETFLVSVIGTSELGVEIPMVTLGSGKKKVLVWSQMHGNESTTTKALIDFLMLIANKKEKSTPIDTFLKHHTLKIIPILNPDGAASYTRVNANGVDLNRDAQLLSQAESKALRAVFDAFKPDLCLNMHDQRTIYGVPSGKSATVSFLSPAADDSCGLTSARKIAMGDIARMYASLSKEIQGQIGRYDDAFNLNCVGDTFTQLGVPTILFEAGHFSGDYDREITRTLIYKALLVVFNISEVKDAIRNTGYFDIPENQKSYCDLLLKEVRIEAKAAPQDIAIQYLELLIDGAITFIPTILELNTRLNGHREVDFGGDHIVFNNTEKVSLNEKLHIVYNKSKEIAISLRI